MNSERVCDSLDGEDMLRSVYLWDSSESRDKVWDMAREREGGKEGWAGQKGTDGFQPEQLGQWGVQSLLYGMQLEAVFDRVQELRFGHFWAT